MTTKRYAQLRSMAHKVLGEADGDGWKLAKYTNEAVGNLMRSEKITQGEAIKRWARDLGHDRFSPTSSRRYFDVWRKYGLPEQRERNGAGKELSFAEHYAIIRGGMNAKRVMEEARMHGLGVQAAAQNLLVVNGNPVTGLFRAVWRVHRAIDEIMNWIDEGRPLSDEEHKELVEAMRLIRRNLAEIQQALDRSKPA